MIPPILHHNAYAIILRLLIFLFGVGAMTITVINRDSVDSRANTHSSNTNSNVSITPLP